MTVNWIHRPTLKPGRSIELLFSSIKPYLVKHISIREFTLPGIGDLNRDASRQHKFLKQLPPSDLTHILGDVHYVAPWIKDKQVHTFHDLESLLQGNYIRKYLKKRLWLYNALKYSESVSVISQHTNSTILDLYPKQKDKVQVIPNPLLFQPYTDAIQKQKQDNFVQFLSIGTKANKNIEGIAVAISKYNKNYCWHIVGKLTPEQTSYLNSLNLNFQSHVNLSEKDLSRLYKSSDLLLFPSFYEGFGIPIIEAQAHGLPVITSNVTAMPEVAGDAALLVNPYNSDEILQAIEKLEDLEIRKSLIEKGYKNIKKYSLEQVAKQYINWYKQVLNA